MDSTIAEFCQRVLDWRHTTLTRHELRAVASHLRSDVAPKLDERERLLEENAQLKRELGHDLPAAAESKRRRSA